MAESITIKALQDASLDAKSLEEVVNGNEVKQVTTRKGETYPSVKKAINTMFENGGLPATPFATKTLMEASALIDGNYAMVTDDTVNNGLYVKTAGAWVKSDYDPVALAAADASAKSNAAKDKAVLESLRNTESALSEKIEHNKGRADLVQFSGSNDVIFAKFDNNAELLLSNMDGKSVQEVTKQTPVKKPTAFNDVFILESGEDVLLRLGSDGDLHIPNIKKPLQKTLNTVTPVINDFRNKDKRLRFTDDVNGYLLNLVAANNGFSPIPYGLMPSNYSITKADIDSLKITTPVIEIPMDSPYAKDDEFVHPYIIECVGTIRGYRYILMINPFRREAYENPVVYGSNDLESFTMLDGFVQPLDVPLAGGYLSDSGFTYDPVNGELIAYWRSSYYNSDRLLTTSQWMRKTKDLLNWTEKAEYIPESSAGSGKTIFSPSILYNVYDGLWYLYHVPSRGRWTYRTATELTGAWSEPAENLPKGGASPWHLEVKYVGGNFVCLLEYLEQGNLYLGVSSDGINWDVCSEPLLDVALNNLYKASFLPKFNTDGSFYLEIFATQNDESIPTRRLLRAQTNSITL